jgi:hypothetical protein
MAHHLPQLRQHRYLPGRSDALITSNQSVPNDTAGCTLLWAKVLTNQERYADIWIHCSA